MPTATNMSARDRRPAPRAQRLLAAGVVTCFGYWAGVILWKSLVSPG